MTKKTIAAIITGIMLLTAVPAFAATPHHDQKTTIHQELSEHHHNRHNKHHRKEIKPEYHKEVKKNHKNNKKHIRHNDWFEWETGITDKGRG